MSLNEVYRNAQITNVSLGYEDHGILTFGLTLKFNGCGCVFGGYALDEYDKKTNKRVADAKSLECLTEIMKTVGVEKWKDLDTKQGFSFIKSLIWDKGNKIMGQYYMSQFEYILFLRKGAGKKINNCGTSDLISVPNKKTKDENGNNIHDTEKPVDLFKVLIQNSSNENEIVFDPFCGVGGCGVACQQLGRKFYGCELDEKYYNIVKERMGKEAKIIKESD